MVGLSCHPQRTVQNILIVRLTLIHCSGTAAPPVLPNSATFANSQELAMEGLTS